MNSSVTKSKSSLYKVVQRFVFFQKMTFCTISNRKKKKSIKKRKKKTFFSSQVFDHSRCSAFNVYCPVSFLHTRHDQLFNYFCVKAARAVFQQRYFIAGFKVNIDASRLTRADAAHSSPLQ